MANQISRLDYFAAHAPQEIPGWFRHIPAPGKPLLPPDWTDLEDEKDRKECKDWLDADFEISPHLKWFADAHIKFQEDGRKWKLADQEARYFQWRQYYGERMGEIIKN